MFGKIVKIRKTFKESSILFQSDHEPAIKAAIEAVLRHRLELDRYILSNPTFLRELEPMDFEPYAPRIVQIMSNAAKAAGVGPMAAVAGALADIALEAMLTAKASVAIVEDGGEIAASSQRPFTIGLYAGKTPLSKQVGFRILPSDCPIGVATSSASTGHVISFGEADSATVFAGTAALADGAATAICNAVKGENPERSIQEGLKHTKNIPGIRGVMIVRGDYVGTFGSIPQFVKIGSEIDLAEISMLDKVSLRTIV